MREDSTFVRAGVTIALVAALALLPVCSSPAETLWASGVVVGVANPQSLLATTTTDPVVRPLGTQPHAHTNTRHQDAPVSSSLGGAPTTALSPVGSTAPERVATAEISGVGRGFGGNQVVDRIAAEAEGAFSQANRMLAAGNRSTPWSRFYQRVKGSGRWYEDLARRNALHQLAEAQLSRSRYVLEARRAGYIVEFNKGSALGLRGARNGLLRPDIQIGIPGGRWGIVDWTTPGSAGKIFNYEHPSAPFLINVTLP